MGRKKGRVIPEAELAKAVFGSEGDGSWAELLAQKYGISKATVYRQAQALKSRAMGRGGTKNVVYLKEVKKAPKTTAGGGKGRTGSTDAMGSMLSSLPPVGAGDDPSHSDTTDGLPEIADAVERASLLSGSASRRNAVLVSTPSTLDAYLSAPELLDVISNLKISSRISRSALAHLDERVGEARSRGKSIRNAELALYAKLAKEFRDLSKTVYEIEEAVVKLSRDAFENIFMKEVLSAIYEADPETGRRIFEAIRSRSTLLGAFIEGSPGALFADGPRGTIEAGTGEEPST